MTMTFIYVVQIQYTFSNLLHNKPQKYILNNKGKEKEETA